MEIRYRLEDFNKGKIVDKFQLQDDGNAQLFMANTCFRRMVKYTPWRTGVMATDVTIQPKKVIYEQQYAHKQYETNKGRSGRGKHWDKKMWNNEKDMVVKEVANYIAQNERK